MRLLTIDIPKQQVMTEDNVPISVNGVIYFTAGARRTVVGGRAAPGSPRARIIACFLMQPQGNLRSREECGA